MDVKLPEEDAWMYVDHHMAAQNRKDRIKRSTNSTREKLEKEKPRQDKETVPVMGGKRAGDPLPQSETLTKLQKKSRNNDNKWE